MHLCTVFLMQIQHMKLYLNYNKGFSTSIISVTSEIILMSCPCRQNCLLMTYERIPWQRSIKKSYHWKAGWQASVFFYKLIAGSWLFEDKAVSFNCTSWAGYPSLDKNAVWLPCHFRWKIAAIELLALAYEDTLSRSIWRAQLGNEYLKKTQCVSFTT